MRAIRAGVLALTGSLLLGGCGFSPYQLPLPGGADLGDEPYTVEIQFRDVLDLVPKSTSGKILRKDLKAREAASAG